MKDVPMTDESIISAIGRGLGIAAMLGILGKHEKAQMFMNHAIVLIAQNYKLVECWLQANKARESKA